MLNLSNKFHPDPFCVEIAYNFDISVKYATFEIMPFKSEDPCTKSGLTSSTSSTLTEGEMLNDIATQQILKATI